LLAQEGQYPRDHQDHRKNPKNQRH
jgi:hypothetical protein